MATINSLPPEIIQLIVESVEYIALYERETGREFGPNLPASNSKRRKRQRARRSRLERGLPSDDDEEDDDDDQDDDRDPNGDLPLDPEEALFAMFGGMFGLGARAPPPAPAAQPGQAPAENLSDEELPPPRSTARTSAPAGLRPGFFSPAPAPAPAPVQVSSASTSRGAANSSEPSPSSSNAKGKEPAIRRGGSESDPDDLPSLESDSKTIPSSAKGKGPAVEDARKDASNSDDMTRNSSSSSVLASSTPAAPVSVDRFPSMINHFRKLDKLPTSSTPSTSSSKLPSSSTAGQGSIGGGKQSNGGVVAVKVKVQDGREPDSHASVSDDNDDAMPPLESVSSDATPAVAPSDLDTSTLRSITTTTATTASASTSSGVTDRPVQAADANFFSGLPVWRSSESLGPPDLLKIYGGGSPPGGDRDRLVEGGGGGGGAPSEPSDDYDDDEYDDDDDEDWEDEDEDEDASDEDGERSNDYDTSSIASDECTFQDGVPCDPLLPLLFVSRPFLHATRKALYRKVQLSNAYDARLLLDSLKEDEHAARTADEELVTPGGKNALGTMIKSLIFDKNDIVGMGPGGGRTYIEVIEQCARLEELYMKPMFVRSATAPLLKALTNLPHLKVLDIQSNNTRDHPFIFTAPRVVNIMRGAPELEDLTVQFMRDGVGEDCEEEAEMFDRFYEEMTQMQEEEDTLDSSGSRAPSTRISKIRRKGLKSFSLYDFDASFASLEVILRDSAQSLLSLRLSRPGVNFDRLDFAETVLSFGHALTNLDVVLPATWYPNPPLTEPFNSYPPPKPKGYTPSKPGYDVVSEVAGYRYILDAVVQYLPHLKSLVWSGPIASEAVFRSLPQCIKTVGWSHCPTIKPKTLAKLLDMSLVTRTVTVTQSDGSKVLKNVVSKVARFLRCVSVSHDDLSWSTEDISVLEDALSRRRCCLHLSSDSHAGLFGGLAGGAIPIPIPFGPLGGGRGAADGPRG